MRICASHVERSPSDRTEETLRVIAEYVLAGFSDMAGSGCPMPEQVLVTGILPLRDKPPFRLQFVPEKQ